LEENSPKGNMTNEIVRPQLAEVEKLYQKHYSTLLGAALNHPGRLMAQDAERIMDALAKCLVEFDGGPSDESFITWATEAIQSAADRMTFFYELHRKYQKSVFAGVWSILSANQDLADESLGYVAKVIAADTWSWALQHLDDLSVPGTARLSTRLYAQGKLHARTWRKSRLRDLEDFGDCDVEAIGSIPGDGSGKLFFDPGRHEDDPDEGIRRLPRSRPIPSPRNSVLAMKSNPPRLWCPTCKSLHAILPVPASEGQMTLYCGHVRPEQLS
jgi:hypothetical protein